MHWLFISITNFLVIISPKLFIGSIKNIILELTSKKRIFFILTRSLDA